MNILRSGFLLFCVLLLFPGLRAQDRMYLSFHSNAQTEVLLNNLSKITFTNGGVKMVFADNSTRNFTVSEVNRIAFSPEFLSGVDLEQAGNNPFLYPNPVKSVLNFKHFSSSEKISVFTVNGMLVLSFLIESDNYSVDLSMLNPGLYLIKSSHQTFKISKL
jgi:hypothetical protein